MMRGKVSTKSTTLMVNNLNVYKKVYKFVKVFTSLIVNDLNVYMTLKEGEVAGPTCWPFAYARQRVSTVMVHGSMSEIL